jgi:UDP-N-acetylmuramyl pentapeptide synthase
LLAAQAIGVDMQAAARELAHVTAPQGRGQQITLEISGAPATLIDESYNANPVSMRAALTLLSQVPMPAIFGRRIAMLGDMLELGPDELKFHAELAEAITALNIDIVHTVGPRMKALHEALPPGKRGLYGERAADICDALVDQVVAGDVVMIKGSNGSKMGSIVQALKERHAQKDKVEG